MHLKMLFESQFYVISKALELIPKCEKIKKLAAVYRICKQCTSSNDGLGRMNAWHFGLGEDSSSIGT